MKSKLKLVEGAIVAPKGFKAAGVFCDIKRLGTGKGSNKGPKRDLALIVSEKSATVAGMFTTNQVCAAPVKVSMRTELCTPQRVSRLKDVLSNHPGPSEVHLSLVNGSRTTMLRLDDGLRVTHSSALMGDLKALLGPGCLG